ncbi:MAG: EF-P lysine aminoacylase GenX [Desulfuromonadales bacterium]|nr:EF-P lysine aminoacylase GenX [Desulfuromonadales bacterium]NIR33669.1 EF-P lysine aminoacylase GenX [Desulfuromonadales bacterium]NIS42360.1 EF-P lysine aminoacylase GenX [Desulfuromonadales bacterium]
MEQNWALARKKKTLQERARIVQTIRAFFIKHGYLEVETPHRVPGNAPEMHIEALPSGEQFLHTSPELPMKRLVAAGYERLFQICRVWRGGERGRLHLPEFTLLEWYRAHVDYTALMTECAELLKALCPSGRLAWQGHTVYLAAPWERLTVAEAFNRHAGCSAEEALAAGRFEEVLSFEVEPRLGRKTPTILCEYPAELAALARRKPGEPSVAERFELYICGLEIANAFSELTDPVEQRERFEADEAARRAAGGRPYPLPENFLRDLGTMPCAAGIALGLDRLVMLLTDSPSIDDVVAFTPEEL